MPRYFFMLDEPGWAGPVAYPTLDIKVRFNKGSRFSSTLPELAFSLKVDRQADNIRDFPPLDYHKSYGGVPLFSARMKQAFDAAGVSNIDYYPARVTYEPNTKLPLEYCAANIIGMTSGLDLSQSVCEIDEDGIVEHVKVIRLDESKFRDQKITWLKEKRLIVIRYDLRQMIEDAGLTGIRIISDIDWKPGMI